MNANYRPQTPVIKDWLGTAKHQLSEIGIESAALDAELILAHVLKKDRTYLHAHCDELIGLDIQNIANKLLETRLKRVPIAYIVGYKDFYGRKFQVSTDTLIPRPESEDIINILKEILPTTNYQLPTTKLIDVGTGSGCLGITSKLEFPQLQVILVDISKDALKVAKKNAEDLLAKVSILNSNLLEKLSDKVDIIIANLPYVDKTWTRSPETDYEPDLALFADEGGVSIINRLITESSKALLNNGLLIIEADPTQHNLIINHAKKKSLFLIDQINYAVAFRLDNSFDIIKK